MVAALEVFTLDEVAERLSYEPESGALRWRTNRSSNARAGDLAGYIRPDGYRSISLFGRRVFAHRLAYWLGTGERPVGEVDHINGDRADNRLANLRLATPSQNHANTPVRARSRTGVKGVYYYPKRRPTRPWVARITVDRRIRHLGYFATAEEANAVYAAAAAEAFGHFGRAE